jgi:hypothetical protein
MDLWSHRMLGLSVEPRWLVGAVVVLALPRGLGAPKVEMGPPAVLAARWPAAVDGGLPGLAERPLD